jgi:hypothetical protein
MALGCGVDIVVSPVRVCPKWITGALRLKFNGIKGVVYALGAVMPGASPGAPTNTDETGSITDVP